MKINLLIILSLWVQLVNGSDPVPIEQIVLIPDCTLFAPYLYCA